MKALVYTATMQSEFRDEADAFPSPGEVIIDVSHCGICGSDMHAWHGHDDRRIPPLILGHEAVGVAKTGKFKGKRVALNPLMTCGECDFCSNGNEHLCAARELIGMRVPGAFAEAVAIREQNLHVLPDYLKFENAALAEPLAVCVHAAKLGVSRTGTENIKAIVLGGGAIGLLTTLVLQQYGISNLEIAETNALRRTLLSNVTAASPYNPIEVEPSQPADLIIDCVGSGITRSVSSTIIKPGGTIVHVGLQDNEPGFDTRHATLQEVNFVGSYCYTNDDFAEALDFLATGKINGDGWTEFRPLSDGGAGFEDIHMGKALPKIILQI